MPIGKRVGLLLALSLCAAPVCALAQQEPAASSAPASEPRAPSNANTKSLGKKYITDTFTITMRRGNDTSFRVIKNLDTGDELNLLETSENGWSRVRTRDNEEGWVLSRFLSDQLPARTRLERAEERLEKLQVEHDGLTQENGGLKEKLANFDALEKELKELRELAANDIALDKSNKRLHLEVTNLETELQQVKDQNRQLAESNDFHFFVAGAAVIVLGFLGGVLVGRSGKSKRRGGYDSGLGF